MDMKKILQAIDGVNSKPVEGSNDMKKFLSVVTEGANPHKVALPVQMAMQHYAKPKIKEEKKPSLLKKYFAEAEDEVNAAAEEERTIKEQRIKQYAQKIANRILVKESKINEVPIEPSGDPNDPTVYGHEKANPMSLKGRIMSARAQLKDLAQMAESNELSVWQRITELHKGGMFMGLAQNLEQIRHGISELASKRKKGGIGSRGIDTNISEEQEDQPDTITVDIPLLIRLLEYSKEDAKTDMDLHNVAEKLISLSKEQPVLSMDDYDAIVGDQELLPAPNNQGTH